MSRVEIYKINKDKRLKWVGDAHNAWLGCMHIWRSLEEKYLPSLGIKPWAKTEEEKKEYYSRTYHMGDTAAYQEIWNLYKDPRLDWNERICMMSTLDNMYIEYDDIPEVAEAYETVEFSNDNMKKQAEIMRQIYEEGKDGSVIGIFKNENSVCSIYDFCDCDPDDNGILFMRDSWDSVMSELRTLRDNDYKEDNDGD